MKAQKIEDEKLDNFYGYVIVENDYQRELFTPELKRTRFADEITLSEIKDQCIAKYGEVSLITVMNIQPTYGDVYIYGNHGDYWEWAGALAQSN